MSTVRALTHPTRPRRSLPHAARPSVTLPEIGVPSARSATLRDLSFLPVADGLWRVVNRSGAVLGHIERSTDGGGDERFAARRLLAATRTMVLGTFWNIDDAADCFR